MVNLAFEILIFFPISIGGPTRTVWKSVRIPFLFRGHEEKKIRWTWASSRSNVPIHISIYGRISSHSIYVWPSPLLVGQIPTCANELRLRPSTSWAYLAWRNMWRTQNNDKDLIISSWTRYWLILGKHHSKTKYRYVILRDCMCIWKSIDTQRDVINKYIAIREELFDIVWGCG